VALIKKLIESGDTYQVNLAFKNKFEFSGAPFGFYLDLKKRQPVAYSAMIKLGRFWVLSFSPELFFKIDGREITVKPMKGTIKRGKTLKEDELFKNILKICPKNRSENLMIVDMLRNDLGRISEYGSVRAEKLFETEKFSTLFQMTSTVKGRLKRKISWYEIFKSLFPSASVTGAPKIRTMEIIADLEPQPRKIYTGAIGFISPGKKAVFNVAIRTVLIDEKTGLGEMGLGSGVVYDSQPEKEYRECLLKGHFLSKRLPVDFELVETMCWDPHRGIFLFDYHLERLKNSARYFGFWFNKWLIINELQKIKRKLKSDEPLKIRLILDRGGLVTLSVEKIASGRIQKNRIVISKFKTDSKDIFLYHKTTHRPLYEAELEKHRGAGYFEVIFTNQKGQITEGAISNIFLKKGGLIFTPPVGAGLLNGVYRQYFMKNNQVTEKIIYPQDLLEAEEIFLTNSVRGVVKIDEVINT
jgi:para-aminobenzoate synthetase/4-amino-4-deoxychorismate lyase